MCNIDGIETPCYSKGSPSAEVALKFYAAMREGCETSTSLINSERFYDEIKPSLEAGKDVIISTISSGISGTYKQACDAAQRAMADFPARKVYVFDSYNASMGEGLFDIYAAKMGDEGKSFEEVCGWLESHRLNMHSVFTVSDLKYLKKGGRVSATKAIAGTLLGHDRSFRDGARQKKGAYKACRTVRRRGDKAFGADHFDMPRRLR